MASEHSRASHRTFTQPVKGPGRDADRFINLIAAISIAPLPIANWAAVPRESRCSDVIWDEGLRTLVGRTASERGTLIGTDDAHGMSDAGILAPFACWLA